MMELAPLAIVGKLR